MALVTRADHEYQLCSDPDCPRFPCRVYREGYVAGHADGSASGEAIGYARGVSDGYSQGHADGYAAGGDG